MESCCRYAGGRSCTSYRSREGGEDLSLDHEWFDRGAPVMKLKIYHHHIIFGVEIVDPTISIGGFKFDLETLQ